ncbi:MAG: HlyD family efflux transporter periplasmic adaptor subunit [Balneolaceae bacterium]|nr:HlyD family efflux transporter periplasmic adaptor subunit [Balneolaceae bacterium]MCH8549342.1 HlyD family efflux transporter periplasmic adaptor subunit [Balneolaceae bacterium]
MSDRKKKNRIVAAGSAIGIILITILLVGLIFPDGDSMADDAITKDSTREVEVTIYEPGEIRSEIRITGRINSTQRIELLSEVQGVLEGGDQPFRTGVRFSRGDLLLKIDQTETELELNAQRSRFFTTLTGTLSDIKLDYPDEHEAWAEYADQFDPEATLPPLPDIENRQLRLYLTTRGIFDQYFSIRGAENRLEKYTIRAPFSGELREADLTPGNLVQPGVRLGEFTGDTYELVTFVSLRDLDFISEGDPVELTAPVAGDSMEGTILRISSSVDPDTQAFPVYIEVRDRALRSGQYLEGSISGKLFENAVEIPRNLLSRSNTVLIAEDGKATHKEVEPLLFKQESVIVSGLTADDKVIELRAGSAALAGASVTIAENDE